MQIVTGVFPLSVILKTEKTMWGIPIFNFYNRCDKLFQETFHFVETGPEILNEIDEESFDVRAVVVLVSHNHNRTVS